MIRNIVFIVTVFLIFSSCTSSDHKSIHTLIPENNFKKSISQLNLLIVDANKADKIPRTVKHNREIEYIGRDLDWTKGFFPGSLWYAYEFTMDSKYKDAAEYFQNKIIEDSHLLINDDLGLLFNNSFGLGYQFTKNKEFLNLLIDAGNSIIANYNPKIGCIKSKSVDRGWTVNRGWEFPVFIESMMDLGLLFELSKLTNDEKYRNIAIHHADVTLENHFRKDHSSYHVVNYNKETGAPISKETAHGYAHESAWARGQAWGLYGFTVCYRYTKDTKYLELAERIAEYLISNSNMPKDLVPYWDFNAPKIPNEPRDASSAAIIASALIELDLYSEQDYLTTAKKIIISLSSYEYNAEIGTNNHFILKHSIGSIPLGKEIDVPLIYADFYYIEALLRLTKNNKTIKIN